MNNDEKHQIQDNNERKVILVIGMGLNGITAKGWLPPAENRAQGEELVDDVWSILENVDAYILGRVSYQEWEGYWPPHANNPSSSEFQKKFSVFINKIQKIVVSSTMKSATWQNSKLINDNISTEISKIKKLPGKNIILAGGAGIAQTFTKLNLIDEYQIYLHQVIFEKGKSVLGVLENERELELVDVKKFQCGGIRLHYRRIK